jgi:ABC-type glycerol-3-phosphate transport system substrate-binding protein
VNTGALCEGAAPVEGGTMAVGLVENAAGLGERPSGRLTRAGLLRRGTALLGVAAGGALAACGAGGQTAGAGAKAELTGPVQIWGLSLFDFSKDVGAEIISSFEAKHPGVKVEYTMVNDDSGDKTRVAAAGDTPPDLTSVNGSTPQSLAADGVAGSYEPFLKGSKVIQKGDLWPTYVNDHSWKGALVGMAYGPDIRLLYTNVDRYARAGLDATKPPKTWKELEEVIAKTAERESGALKTIGFHPFIGSGNELLWLVPFWQLGGDLLSPDGTKVTIDNEKGIQAWEWLVKTVDAQGGYAALQEARKAGTPQQLFVNGQQASYYDTNSTRTNDAFKKAIQGGFKYGFGSYPTPPNGRRVTFGGVHTFIMPKGSKRQPAAWAFLEHLLSPEQNIKYADFYDRIPVRRSVANSEQYIRGEPFRKLSVEEMAGRKWLIPAPGAWAMRSDVSTVTKDVLESGMSIRAALAKTQATLQQKLDAALQAAR